MLATSATWNARAERAVHAIGGRMFFTDEVTFSSSSLLNEHFGVFPPETRQYLKNFSNRHKTETVIEKIRSLRGLRVCVVGDAIIDEYHYTSPLGTPGKGHGLAVQFESEEQFAGGAIAVANHVAGFCDHVTLATGVGHRDGREHFIRSHLQKGVEPLLLTSKRSGTLIKRRYVDADLSKLFEVYLRDGDDSDPEVDDRATNWLDEQFSEMFELPGLVACPADLPPGVAVWIYGCGSAGRFLRRLLERVRPDVRVIGFVDSKVEGEVDGLPVVLPKRLAGNEAAAMVLIASSAREAIEKELRSQGVDSYRAVLPHLFSQPAPDVSVSDADWLSMKPLRLSNAGSCFAPIFGLEIYEKMHASKIIFNYHSEPAKGTVDNMRLFQATGVGSCLVTDSGSNLPDLFEPGTEVVTYSSLQECLEKVRYLLDHDDARQSIARAGQRRTLRDHTAKQRYGEFEALLVDQLLAPTPSRRRARSSTR